MGKEITKRHYSVRVRDDNERLEQFGAFLEAFERGWKKRRRAIFSVTVFQSATRVKVMKYLCNH